MPRKKTKQYVQESDSKSLPLPSVTVAMPVYNGASLFPRAIESILAQTFQDFEIIISDNGSTDGTAAIVADYAAMDPRIRSYHHKKTSSALDNYRFALENARGEYFFWAPHDDWWDREFISSAIKALGANPQAAGAMGTVHYIGRDGDEFMRDEPPYHLDASEPLVRLFSYYSRNVTDNLYYAVFRRPLLNHLYWSRSSCPEKIVILQAICRGPIVDAEGMAYYNQYAFKTAKEVAQAFHLPTVGWRQRILILTDSLRTLRQEIPFPAWIRVSIFMFFAQRWPRKIARMFIDRVIRCNL